MVLNSRQDLVKDIQEKKVEAFEELYRLYYEALTVFAQTYVYQMDIAEDIVQESFFQLWDTDVSTRIHKSIKSYLYAAVRNKCLNHLRHLQVEDKYRQKEMEAISFSGSYEMLEDDELIEKVKKAVEELPEKCKLTFKMCVLQEMRYKEVSEELGVSIDTVKDHMKRAYRFLRKYRFDDYLKLMMIIIAEKWI